jgi:hypothetical protein
LTDIEWWVYPVVLIGLLVVSYLLHRLVVDVAAEGTPAKQYGMAALFIGVDGRTSTSKLQAVLWTYAILWALISVLVGAGAEEFAESIGSEVRDEYFLLLGGPYLVAIAAKAKTTHDVSKASEEGRADPKGPKPSDAPSRPRQLLAEVVTKDDGSVDLGDFQYFAFTLVSLTYFAWAFIASPDEGLPEIPGTLLVLTGVSQAAYLGKKVLLEPSPAEERVVQQTVSGRQGPSPGAG